MRAPRIDDTAWLRRHALQIAAQLPDDPNEARAVLRYAEELVTKFLEEGGANAGPALRVVDKGRV